MSEKSKKGSDNETNNQVLSYYVDNRVKLMQEVFSLIKPKKVVSMAPDFMKEMQLSEVKSLLLDELLGISNKRLRSIIAGESIDPDTSSSSEFETDRKLFIKNNARDKSNDSDFCIDIELSENERLELERDHESIERAKKENNLNKSLKRKDSEKHNKRKRNPINKKVSKTDSEPVVNVLNLLELQARARAIRSQLANEILLDKSDNSLERNVKLKDLVTESLNEDNSPNSVICLSPDNLSVVSINSSTDIDESAKNEETDIASTEIPNNSNITKDVSETNNEKVQIEDSNFEPWKSRWLESKKVQDVIKSIKIYNNIRHARKKRQEDKNAETEINKNDEVLSEPSSTVQQHQ